MTNLEILFLALSAVVGALLAVGIDVSSSSETFDLKKLIYALLTGIIGAVVVVFLNFQVVVEVTGWTYLEAFLMGAGAQGFSKAATAVQNYRNRRKS